jgi:DivIVA domain-containing protein
MRKEFRGYAPDQVDVFLARCLATPGISRSHFPELRHLTPAGAPVTVADVEAVRFGQATWGYPIRRVDDLLDRLAGTLAVSAHRPATRSLSTPAPWLLVDAIRLPAPAPRRPAGPRPFLTQPPRPRT